MKLDTITSDFLEECLDDEDIAFGLVPPYLYRRNSVERAIRTFKDYCIAILSGTNPTFPINLWDKLLPQAIVTLNLLRMSRINPQLFDHVQLWDCLTTKKYRSLQWVLNYSFMKSRKLDNHGLLSNKNVQGLFYRYFEWY